MSGAVLPEWLAVSVEQLKPAGAWRLYVRHLSWGRWDVLSLPLAQAESFLEVVAATVERLRYLQRDGSSEDVREVRDRPGPGGLPSGNSRASGVE
jgi:hypothetical protein